MENSTFDVRQSELALLARMIPERHSARTFTDAAVSDALLEEIRLCAERHRAGLSQTPGARVEIFAHGCDTIMTGLVGSYGKLRGTRAFAAFIADTRAHDYETQIGYLGEAVILKATELGLGTCWVGGFFDAAATATLVRASEHERVVAVTPIGYAADTPRVVERLMKSFVRSHTRLAMDKLLTSETRLAGIIRWPEWMGHAVEAARLAPSAINRQPWRFSVEGDIITVSFEGNERDHGISKRLDCGIALLHLEAAAALHHVTGTWEILKSPQVARFIPRTSH